MRERRDFSVVEVRTNLKFGGIHFVDRNEIHEKGREILQMRVRGARGRASRGVKLLEIARTLTGLDLRVFVFFHDRLSL